MKIPTLEISPAEMREAVEQWLTRKGFNLKVTETEESGYPVNKYKITCEEKPTMEAQAKMKVPTGLDAMRPPQEEAVSAALAGNLPQREPNEGQPL